MPYVSFSCLTALTRNSGTTLNRLSSRHPYLLLFFQLVYSWSKMLCFRCRYTCLISDVSRYAVQSFTIKCEVSCKFFRCPLSGQLRKFLSISSLLSVSVLKECWIFFFFLVKCFFWHTLLQKWLIFCFSFSICRNRLAHQMCGGCRRKQGYSQSCKYQPFQRRCPVS